ncbi:protein-export chaperone SecB [Vulcaniibacterium tengchongense]|uniref:Protein-export protein SecB n=1 Tax=Vulcaniibacterium tengchongense TaxID=1273429 RepID=A0A3N4W4T8_9GAMM|nr:protein-export chaperone SecB [Vulcaniibacterium tengchongense]RPE80234.1 protein translocase subunit secB [Vulcaniibacterium tengchongense]
MSEETANGAAAPAETAGPAFTVEKIYVKDVSFEVPGAPAVFNEQAQPQLQMNLNQSVQRLNENVFEVVLGITLTCSIGDKSVYLAEVKQAGVFGLAGFDVQTLDAMLGTHCPNILYPYARQLISDLISAGGFPPFFLQPINFEALYAEGLRQRAAQQQNQGGLADAETAGNA